MASVFIDKDGVMKYRPTTYRGVKGTIFYDHGEWSDAEVEYDGELINVNYIEDYMWDEYNEDCRRMGIKVADDNYESFNEWIEEQGGAQYVEECINEVLAGMHGI